MFVKLGLLGLLGLLSTIVVIPVYSESRVIAGADYATITHQDGWDMSNTDDIFPLSWVHNLGNTRFENGVLIGTPKDGDPHVWLQFPQIPSSIPTLNQREQKINASQFNQLSFYLWLPDNIGSGKTGRIVWHAGANTIEAFDVGYSESALFPVQAGWHLYTVDLGKVTVSSGRAWKETIEGFRIDPCVGGCDEFRLDWVRLISPELSSAAFYNSSNSTTNTLLIDSDNNDSNGFLTTISGNSGMFSFAHLPPGKYYISPTSDNNYAFSQRADLWDMNESSDILSDLTNDWMNPSVNNGVFSGTTNGADPNITLQIPNDRPIDASKYKFLSVTMSLSTIPDQETGLLVFWGNQINAPSFRSDFISTQAGTKTYTIDLSSNPNWQGKIRSLRIDPLNGANANTGINVIIDGVHLTKTGVNNSDQVNYLDDPVVVNSPPSVTIHTPNVLSGNDYATEVLNNSWNMDNSHDVANEQNLISSAFVNRIPDLNLSGDFFTANSIARSPEGDPGVWFLFQETLKPIAADKYHLLSFDLYVPFDANNQQELTDGAVVRVAWKQNDFDVGVTTDDLLTQPGLHTYQLDMKQVRYEPTSTKVWSGLIQYLRLDPLEFPTSRNFFVDSVKLLSLPSYAQLLPLNFTLQDSDNDTLDITIMVDGNVYAQRNNLVAKEHTVYLDTNSLNVGEHNLSLVVTDSFNSSSTSTLVPFKKTEAAKPVTLPANETIYDLDAQVLHIPKLSVQGLGEFSVNMGLTNSKTLEFTLHEVQSASPASLATVSFDFDNPVLELPQVKLINGSGLVATYQVTMEIIPDSDPIRFKVTKLLLTS